MKIKWDKVVEKAKVVVPDADKWDIRCAGTLIEKCPGVFPKWMYSRKLFASLEDCGWVLKTIR